MKYEEYSKRINCVKYKQKKKSLIDSIDLKGNFLKFFHNLFSTTDNK